MMILFDYVKDAAKKVLGGRSGGSALPRRLGALLLALTLLAAIPTGALAAPDGSAPAASSAPADSSAPVNEAALSEAGSASRSTIGDDFVFVSGTMAAGEGTGEKDRADLYNFLTDLQITDAEGKPVEDTLYVGEEYHIHLGFGEGGPQGLQLDETGGKLTYQIPKNFHVNPVQNQPLEVEFNGQTITLGYYSIDENGMLTLELTDDGKNAIKSSNDIKFAFDMTATAVNNPDSGDGSVDFGGTGKDFNFKVVDQPRVDVDKTGNYAEIDDEGGELSYTVTTTVKHGEVHDVVLTDVLTPPESDAFEVSGEPTDVVVTITRDGEPVTLEPGKDYDLVEDENEGLTGEKNFKVVLKGDYKDLKEGDEVSVEYKYGVTYNENGTGKYQCEIKNEAVINGTMEVPDPKNPDVTTSQPFEEREKNSVNMERTPPGHGVVSKDQRYSEIDHTLHYTLYTTVPAGEWRPLFIFDDMVVNYRGEKWYIPEFSSDGHNLTGRVQNLKVSMVTMPDDWFDDWDSSEVKDSKTLDFEALKAQATVLKGYDFWEPFPANYNPEDMKQYFVLYGVSNMSIVFGMKDGEKDVEKEHAGNWGHWNITGHDTLIITEYDLDMSKALGDTVELVNMDDMNETIELSPDEILLAGITNNVHLRFGPYYPGYSVYFNNSDELNKDGEIRKEGKDVYIDYTVSINISDNTVKGYFQDLAQDWIDSALKWKDVLGYEWWDYNQNGNMQAVFYDVLPEGWTYVEGSLYATYLDKYNNLVTLDNISNMGKGGIPGPTDENGDICAPLAYFINDKRPLQMFDALRGPDGVELTFHYTLKADEDWLAKNVAAESVKVVNHAEIKDKDGSRWDDENTETYIPDRLTKQAEQVEGTNLLKFTLDVNPAKEMYKQENMENPQSFLVVKDKSTNLQVKEGTIQVFDAETGKELTYAGTVTMDALRQDDWDPNSWGTVAENEDGQFKIVIPNGKHVTVTYDALVMVEGTDVRVSNEASIDGVLRSSSKVEKSLEVHKIEAGGQGSSYSMSFIKKDQETGERLSGAEFNFYIVRSENSALEQTDEIQIGSETYSCYTEPDWVVKIGENGTFDITKDMSWNLYPGNYYILKETKAPADHELLKDPYLFYFGYASDQAYNGATLVAPGGELTVYNTPVKTLRVVKVDSGTSNQLAGAQFELRKDSAEGDALWMGTSGADGAVAWSKDGEKVTELQLESGTYYLTETGAPAGYRMLEGPVSFEVNEYGSVSTTDSKCTVRTAEGDKYTIELVIPNETGYVLPESGGAGVAGLYVTGVALMAAGAMALLWARARKKAAN